MALIAKLLPADEGDKVPAEATARLKGRAGERGKGKGRWCTESRAYWRCWRIVVTFPLQWNESTPTEIPARLAHYLTSRKPAADEKDGEMRALEGSMLKERESTPV